MLGDKKVRARGERTVAQKLKASKNPRFLISVVGFIRIWESLLAGSSDMHVHIAFALYAWIISIRFAATAVGLAHACLETVAQRQCIENHISVSHVRYEHARDMDQNRSTPQAMHKHAGGG